MILAPASEVSPEADPMLLFLGPKPLTVIGRSAERRPAAPLGNDQDRAGSILILAESSVETTASNLPGLLAECHRHLPANGRIAVLARNRGSRAITFLRSLMSSAGRRASDDSLDVGIPLRDVVEPIHRAGFDDIAVFSVYPSADDPLEIRPVSWRDTWLAPAFLVTAGMAGVAETFLLQRIAQTIDRTQPGDSRTRRVELKRVIHSSRGKSIAILAGGASQIVVRMSRSAVMTEDESRSYRLLQQIQANPAVAHQTPQPLGSEIVGDIAFFAQSHVGGQPLSTKIRDSNRADYLLEVSGFLRALNANLATSPIVSFDDGPAASIIQPMIRFALQHLADDALREKATALLADALSGASGRLGIVHGDFGTGNILVEGTRITGVIDWEAGRAFGSPLLDAFNYLDSAHRCCRRDMSLVDTLPMLAGGDWPIAGELDFLKEFFRYCGVDFRYRRGFALLYALFHFGPQLRFANVEAGPRRRLEKVLRQFVKEETRVDTRA